MLINYSGRKEKKNFSNLRQIKIYVGHFLALCTRDWKTSWPESYLHDMAWLRVACWLPFGISHWDFQITLLAMIDRIQLPKHTKTPKNRSSVIHFPYSSSHLGFDTFHVFLFCVYLSAILFFLFRVSWRIYDGSLFKHNFWMDRSPLLIYWYDLRWASFLIELRPR